MEKNFPDVISNLTTDATNSQDHWIISALILLRSIFKDIRIGDKKCVDFMQVDKLTNRFENKRKLIY